MYEKATNIVRCIYCWSRIILCLHQSKKKKNVRKEKKRKKRRKQDKKKKNEFDGGGGVLGLLSFFLTESISIAYLNQDFFLLSINNMFTARWKSTVFISMFLSIEYSTYVNDHTFFLILFVGVSFFSFDMGCLTGKKKTSLYWEGRKGSVSFFFFSFVTFFFRSDEKYD